MYQESIKKELEKLTKEELINIIAELANVYISYIIEKQENNISNIQKCVCQLQTNIQEVNSNLKQEINANFQKIR